MIGKLISHYEIFEKLGEGGMGVVYRARDTRLKRTVALKFLPPELMRDSDAKQRFIHEAQAASSLEHPNICTIHEIDETPLDPGLPGESQVFICMTYYDGQTLKTKIKEEGLSGSGMKTGLKIKEVIDIAVQVVQGLAKAHTKGIVHRDIKPANILVTEDGMVKILDFGLAKLAGQTTLTKPDQTPGTVAYMSPEQIRGEKVDHRTDIWSFGIVLYEMLTGELPFKGDYPQAILYSILQEEPQTISDHQKRIPYPLIKIVERCLAKDREQRFPDADSLLIELQNNQKEKTLQKKPKKAGKRSAWLVIPLLIILLTLTLVLTTPLINRIKNLFNPQQIPEEKHLAILPCLNIGDIPANRAFCDGICETLSSKLTQLQKFQGSLWIVPFSETRVLETPSVNEARKQFGVNLAVTSSFQREADNIRFTMNLVDAESMRQLSSRILDTDLYLTTLLQDSILYLLTDMLEVEINPRQAASITAGQTRDPQANELYIQGQGYLLNYDNETHLNQAIQLFHEAVKRDPDFPLAYNGLGQGFWHKFKLDKDRQWLDSALYYCNIAEDQNSNLADVQTLKGNLFLETGSLEDAVSAYRQALRIDSLSFTALRGLARTYEQQGSESLAENTFKKAITINPSSWSGYSQLGAFYFRRGRYPEALQQFQQVVHLVPDNIRGYANLGGMYFYLGRREEARKMFEKSLKIKPTYQAYANLGTLYFYQNQFPKAAQMYRSALEISDHDYRIWGNLAEACYWTPAEKNLAADNFQKALSVARKTLEIAPHDPEVMSDMAGYYARLGKAEVADSILQVVIEGVPEDKRVLFNIGDCYEQLGNREQALVWLERALAGGYSLSEIETNPGLTELKRDIRFQNILKKIKADTH